jgi:hypothetical protein
MATAAGVARERDRRMIEQQPDTADAAQTGMRRDLQLHGKAQLRMQHGNQDRVVARASQLPLRGRGGAMTPRSSAFRAISRRADQRSVIRQLSSGWTAVRTSWASPARFESSYVVVTRRLSF